MVASLAAGCGGESEKEGPVEIVFIDEQKVNVAGTDVGIIVSGDSGAVAPSARVDAVNASTAQTVTASAAADGSFELTLPGAPTDEVRLYATLDEQSWRARYYQSGLLLEVLQGVEGRAFTLVSADGYVPVAEIPVHLSFEYAGLSLDAGCNSISGPYSACDGRLCVSDLMRTLIGCDADRLAQDDWMSAFLRSSPRLIQQGPRLMLAGTEATLELIEADLLNPDRPLMGRTWTIDTLSDGPTSRSVSLAPTVTFPTINTLQVFTTCTTGSGSYTAYDGSMGIYDMAYGEEPCGAAGDAGADELIRQVLGEGDQRYEIDVTRLTIRRGVQAIQATTE
jgi:heat shock protein HslJ